LGFGGDIDLEGLIKDGDPSLIGFIILKAKKFTDYFNPDKVRLGRYVDFDSLQSYGIRDMFASLELFVFLK